MKRLSNLLISLVTLARLLVRKEMKGSPRLSRLVIVYPTGNIGDMVCLTPLLSAVRKHAPHARITVVGAQSNRPLLADHPDVYEYLSASLSFLRLVSLLRRGEFEAGIVLGSSVRDIGLLVLGNVKHITCFELDPSHKEKEPRSYRMLSRFLHRVPYVPGVYFPSQTLRLLAPLGFNAVYEEKRLGYSKESIRLMEENLERAGILPKEKFIVIAPGAGSNLKRWPTGRFAALVNGIIKKHNIPIVVVGGPKDQHVVEEMISCLDSAVRYWNPGALSLDSFKALLSRSDIVIGNDSGAVHVGEALGRKTLVIAGATDVDEHFREDARHRIVRGVLGGPTYQAYVVDEARMDPALAQRQMESVSVEAVSRCLAELIDVVNERHMKKDGAVV